MSESAPGSDVAAAFVELVDTLVASDLDVETYLAAVCRHCVSLVGVASAAIIYAEAPQADAARIASSDELGRWLAGYSLGAGAGPWAECLTTGQLITVGDLRSDDNRWPDFARVALRAGTTAVTVVPVRSHLDVLGALALLGGPPPDATGIHLACSLADVTGAGIVLSHELRRQQRDIARLQAALTSRIVIEQAKGILAERWKVAPDEAFDRLRKHARDTRRPLPDLAMAVINGTAKTTAPGPVTSSELLAAGERGAAP
jgi:hypothetical protein